MAAKVRHLQGAWWVVTHHQGTRNEKRVGPTKAHKREADRLAKQVNAALITGTYRQAENEEAALACDQQVREWLVAYAPTLKATTQKLYSGLIENHLVPYFGARGRATRLRQGRTSAGYRNRSVTRIPRLRSERKRT